jgi:hypothetical protein
LGYFEKEAIIETDTLPNPSSSLSLASREREREGERKGCNEEVV